MSDRKHIWHDERNPLLQSNSVIPGISQPDAIVLIFFTHQLLSFQYDLLKFADRNNVWLSLTNPKSFHNPEDLFNGTKITKT